MSNLPDAVPLAFVTSMDDLLASPFKRRFTVTEPLPICGARFRIRSLTEGELSSHQAQAVGKDGFRTARMEDANRRLIARCLVDGDGNRLVSDAQVGRLANLDAADTQALYEACSLFVGLKRADPEDLVKNSEGTRDA